MTNSSDQISDSRVALGKLDAALYPKTNSDVDVIYQSLTVCAKRLGWYDKDRGPLGKLINSGERVVIKPNFVLHKNEGPWGMEPMVTHRSFVTAVTKASLLTDASAVLVGDAPIQGCNFRQLLNTTNLDSWANDLMAKDARFRGIYDFRRTTCQFVSGVRIPSEELLPEDQFVLFDLGEHSLLEPIADGRESFRVTCYDPRLLARTHAPGIHRYLVSKDIIEADVVINLPKLKTHKKAGITCALKNLIGINGNKEYLPHHRIGGTSLGGDCYPENSRIKRALEYVTDQQNLTSSPIVARLFNGIGTQLNRVLHLMGDRLGIEGSWSGNDTVWRTALDLNRILLYGRVDGTLAEVPQRKLVHIVDGVIAGQGEGPLAPQPLPLGVLIAGRNAAAIDWVGAQLLGFDPVKLPIVREAFSDFKWPIASFTPDEVSILNDSDCVYHQSILQCGETQGRNIIFPLGWADAAARGSKESL